MNRPYDHRKPQFWGMAVIVYLISPANHAAQPDTSQWKCAYCPFQQGGEAENQAGGGLVTDESARFGNANGYDEQGGFLVLDGDGSYVDQGIDISWYLEDIGLNSRYLEVTAGRPDRYALKFAYRGLPYRLFDTTDTVFTETSNSLALPENWTRAATTNGFTDLNTNLSPRDIESDRDVFELGGNYRPRTEWKFFADYRYQSQNGIDEFGGASFTQASLLPRSFQYRTDEMDLGVRYENDRSYAQLDFYGSAFQNENSALTWENPFTSPPGAERSALSEPPDNRFGQISLKLGYQFGRAIRLRVTGALGNMIQDDALLSYTINPYIDTEPLPQTKLKGEVDTTNLLISLSSRPTTALRLKFSYRYDERDNKTVQETWSRVIADSFPSGELESNLPYSFKRSDWAASADWRIRSGLRLAAGFDRQERDRDFQEVAQQTEDTGWGRVQWRPNAYLQIRGRAGAARREIDQYDSDRAQSFGQNPLLRKYNLAHRYREFGQLTLTGSLPDAPLSLSASVSYADDDYSKSELGLLGSEEIQTALDLNWFVSTKVQLYANAGWQQVEADQAGSSTFSRADWQVSSKDEFSTLGFGFKLKEISERIDLTLDYIRGTGNSTIQLNRIGESPSPFPDLGSTLDSLRLNASFRQTKRIEWFAEFRFENFKADDWALQGVAPDTIPTVLSLGADPYDYDVIVVKIGLNFRFGSSMPTVSTGSD